MLLIRVLSRGVLSENKVFQIKDSCNNSHAIPTNFIVYIRNDIWLENAFLVYFQRVISTVPTLRKIQDPSVTKLISTPQTDSEATASTTQLQIRKVNHTNLNNNNSEPKLLNAQIASGTYGKSSASSHQVVRKIVPAEQRTSTSTSDEPPRTKQYSTLKSPPLQMSLKTSPEFTEEQISMLFGKRSPTPEALRRKHCNCTKSQCLKLYCDCFANGEFCQDCNCKECYNNLEYEDERQKAIKICLERNPNAFK